MTSSEYSLRLDHDPRNLVDRSKTVAFSFEGTPILAYQGDTIASALYASGVRVFSRSFKYHRPRGLLCVAGRCPNCLMTVDGVPNVRTCTEKAREGLVVRHQNAWPSLERDFLSVLDKLGGLMPVGFYYKTFHHPKLFWRVAQPVIRRIAGLGVLEVDSPPRTRYGHQYLHTDVAVVGGGPAGLSAAFEAAAGGAKVTLIDDQPSLGGVLRFDTRSYRDLSGVHNGADFEVAEQLVRSVGESERVQVLSEATAFGLYQDNLLGVLCKDRIVKLRAKQVIVATGSYELPHLFDRNDLPGVMLATGARRLMHLYGVKPGTTALVATSGDGGYHTALDLVEAGVRLAALVDARPGFPHQLDAAQALRAQGVLILTSHTIARAEGPKKVTAAVVAALRDGMVTTEERQFDCDLICMSGNTRPADLLLYQAGSQPKHDTELLEMVATELPENVSAAGEVTGLNDLASSILQGKLAGAEAAVSVSHAVSTPYLQKLRHDLESNVTRQRDNAPTLNSSAVYGQGARRFVCVCEDVTTSDVLRAIDEGFDDIQTLKRYSTVTMGPCQGKMCLKSLVDICARHTGRSIDETGLTTSRPPLHPVPLGALAGPSRLPIKLTPMDRKHLALGALMVDLGQWQRAHSYGSPHDECLAVRERVGIIDVSTLGKLDVKGRDAPMLLDKVYTHRFSDLRVGRIRYALMCSENGTIMDDGTVTRMGEEHYFVTTTSGNADVMEEWLKWWLAGTGMCVHVTNMTSGFAAINVAGPRSRDTLSKLTDIDLSPTAFRYMRSARGAVAGVDTILLRIGFVGESGWELHFPAEHGEYLWDALTEAGEEFGIAPFGLEAQRILRLEKKHIIVGQDTDAVSNPLEGDLSWVVRFDKEDFVGRSGLLAVQERGLTNKLIGFVMRDGRVPEDGDPVVVGQRPVGRVTSARLSPTLGRGFGMAWVPTELASEGGEIRIQVDGKSSPATVTLQPFYDPEGKRLRE